MTHRIPHPGLGAAAALCGLVLALAVSASPAAAQDFDVLIRGGTVVDGSGGPEHRADLGIVGDEIVAVGRHLGGATADRIIEAEGLLVTPGFIDLHSHADRYMIRGDREYRLARSQLKQGIATVVGGPDGRNPAFPLTEELSVYEDPGIGLNFVPMVGHQTVRGEVMGEDYERHATAEEVEAMQALVREGMEAGAWGLGTGFEYRPSRFSHPDEAIALAEVVAEYGGFHFSHMRGSGRLPKPFVPSMLAHNLEMPAYTGHSGPSLIPGWSMDSQDAIREIIEIARRTGIPSVASHVKAKGRMSWGRALSDIILVEAARAEGLPVYLDQYPYEGHSGGNGVVIPYWALVDEDVDTSGGLDSPVYGEDGVFDNRRENLRRVLDDPELRERLRVDTEYVIDYKGGPDRLVITQYRDEDLLGRTVADAAEMWGLTPEETIWQFVLEGMDDVTSGVFLRPLSLHPRDVELYMKQDYTATSSDARLISGPGLHPRHYGAFARKIAHYVRDEGVVSLSHGVRSSSGLPAQIIGLPDRGLLKEGFKADVLVFDLEEFEDRSTNLDPEQYAVGMRYMLVNGTFAIDGGVFQEELAGQVLRRHHVQTQRARADR
jgi:N-acyl-D-amino-acid deacylase